MRVGFKVPVLLLSGAIIAACGGGDKEQPQIGPVPGYTGVVANTSYDPQIAVDGKGNAFAVWSKFDGAHKNIWANRYVAGSGWGSPQMIENDSAGDADLPQIAVDAAGNAIAVWHHIEVVRAKVEVLDDPTTEIDESKLPPHCEAAKVAAGGIWANRYDAIKQQWGGVWQIETDNSAIVVELGSQCKLTAHDASNPHIAADGAGNFVAVWEQSDGVRKNIRANRYDAVAGKWGATPDTIEANTADANSPQMAADGKGNFVAVWRQMAASSVIPGQYDSVQQKRYNLWANRYDAASQRWGGASLVSDNSVIPADPSNNPLVSGNVDTPHLAMDANGNALAVWAQSNHIYASRYVTGSGWQAQARLESDANWAAAAPRIAMMGNGDALVVWEQYFDNNPHDNIPPWKNIWSNRYVAGVWQVARIIEHDDGHALTPQAALDGAGNALAVWRQWDGAHYSIWSNRFDAAGGTGWGTPGLIETNGMGNALSPQIAMDSAGNALAVWSQSNGTRTSIHANRYLAGDGWGSAGLVEAQ